MVRDEAGRIYLGLRHGARLLEIARGTRAIDVGTMGTCRVSLRSCARRCRLASSMPRSAPP